MLLERVLRRWPQLPSCSAKREDITYANTLLERSESLFSFADQFRGRYSDSIAEVQSFYNSWSGFNDELAYGAAWLARALDSAGLDGADYRAKAHRFYEQSIGGLNNGWTHNWDDASYATAVFWRRTPEMHALNDIENWLNSWVDGTNGVTITDGNLRYITSGDRCVMPLIPRFLPVWSPIS